MYIYISKYLGYYSGGPQEAAAVPHQRSVGGGSRGRSESLTATSCPPFSWAKPDHF